MLLANCQWNQLMLSMYTYAYKHKQYSNSILLESDCWYQSYVCITNNCLFTRKMNVDGSNMDWNGIQSLRSILGNARSYSYSYSYTSKTRTPAEGAGRQANRIVEIQQRQQQLIHRHNTTTINLIWETIELPDTSHHIPILATYRCTHTALQPIDYWLTS